MPSFPRSWSGSWWTYLDDNPDANPPATTFLKNGGSYSDTVSFGGNIRDWRQRLKSNLPCTTSLTGDIRSIRSRGNCDIRVKRAFVGAPNTWRILGAGGEINWQFFQLIGAPSISLTSANNAALARFINKADSLVSAFQGITFLGEIRETIQMIRHPLQGLFGNVTRHIGQTGKIRRRLGESNRSLADRVSDIWLEKSFGWQPLLHDIDNGMQALSRLGMKSRPVQRVSGAQTDKKYLASVFIPQQIAFGQALTTVRKEESASVRYHGAVVLDWEEYSQGFTHFGFRLDSVLPAVWELIPYSFLVDYFTNVGDIIKASSFAASRLAWVEKGTELRSSEHRSISWSAPANDASFTYEVLSSLCSNEISQNYRSVSRSDWSGQSLVPSLELKLPGLGMRWLNILALGQQHRSAARRVYG